jgi:hypothetical protein
MILIRDGHWEKGKVLDILDEMVQCSCSSNERKSLWIERESDALAPPNTMTQNQTVRINQLLDHLIAQLTN